MHIFTCKNVHLLFFYQKVNLSFKATCRVRGSGGLGAGAD
ncbi:unnamed protein product [Staurois parvus]|uniref:Uncharacterized protein n=1 Tax=Staurois parvus TaxID=386267 RepID=A0ABN9H3R2_9NEOB|nr:unnamed protein product [Staurois parvus]